MESRKEHMPNYQEYNIQWHPACFAALNLEFAENKQDLKFQQELALNELPYRLDTLIIKKRRNCILKNEIGKLFRIHNLVEYKAPETTLSFHTFLKGIVYVLLYKLHSKNNQTIPFEDITLTFIREGYPRNLFKKLRSYHFSIEEKYKGIYYVYKEDFIATQIIVSKRLDPHNHMWLNALTKKLDRSRAEALLAKTTGLTNTQDKQNADAIWEIVTKANLELIEEMRRDSNMCKAIAELFKPEFDAALEVAVAEAVEEAVEAAVEAAVKIAVEEAVTAEREIIGIQFFQTMIQDGLPREKAQKYAKISDELVEKALATM